MIYLTKGWDGPDQPEPSKEEHAKQREARSLAVGAFTNILERHGYKEKQPGKEKPTEEQHAQPGEGQVRLFIHPSGHRARMNVAYHVFRGDEFKGPDGKTMWHGVGVEHYTGNYPHDLDTYEYHEDPKHLAGALRKIHGTEKSMNNSMGYDAPAMYDYLPEKHTNDLPYDEHLICNDCDWRGTGEHTNCPICGGGVTRPRDLRTAVTNSNQPDELNFEAHPINEDIRDGRYGTEKSGGCFLTLVKAKGGSMRARTIQGQGAKKMQRQADFKRYSATGLRGRKPKFAGTGIKRSQAADGGEGYTCETCNNNGAVPIFHKSGDGETRVSLRRCPNPNCSIAARGLVSKSLKEKVQKVRDALGKKIINVGGKVTRAGLKVRGKKPDITLAQKHGGDFVPATRTNSRHAGPAIVTMEHPPKGSHIQIGRYEAKSVPVMHGMFRAENQGSQIKHVEGTAGQLREFMLERNLHHAAASNPNSSGGSCPGCEYYGRKMKMMGA